MANAFSFLNRLLPFATPGTPVWQDVIHLAAVCAVLYFAPQIQGKLQSRRGPAPGRPEDQAVEDAERPRDATEGQNDQGHVEEPNARLGGAIADPQDVVAPDDNHDPRHALQNDGGTAHAGPGPARQATGTAERNVGAKKMKSNARKDQRRAYNEWLRWQGDDERSKNAEGAEERERAVAAEQERRKEAARMLEAKKAKERELKRQRDDAERKLENERKDLILSIVPDNLEEYKMCDLFALARQLGDDVDEEWIEKVLKASGMLGKKNDEMTLITETGWIVRVHATDLQRIYLQALELSAGADDDGEITNNKLGDLLETSLREYATPT